MKTLICSCFSRPTFDALRHRSRHDRQQTRTRAGPQLPVSVFQELGVRRDDGSVPFATDKAFAVYMVGGEDECDKMHELTAAQYAQALTGIAVLMT